MEAADIHIANTQFDTRFEHARLGPVGNLGAKPGG